MHPLLRPAGTTGAIPITFVTPKTYDAAKA